MAKRTQIEELLILVALTLGPFLIIFMSAIVPRAGELLIFMLIGFVAQLVDGAIGMAYGVLSNSFLLSIGVPPAPASASIHITRIFTSLASGTAHLKLGNFSELLFRKLVIPGMIGGVVGAYLLTAAPVDLIRHVVNSYLLVTGLMIIISAICRGWSRSFGTRYISLLGGVGGFVDSIGGGGWGPVVTSTLIANGHNPRIVVGSVSLAKFFITIVQSAAFMVLLGLVDWRIIIGLAIGGVMAAPLSAYICKGLSIRTLTILAGLMVITLSLRNILR